MKYSENGKRRRALQRVEALKGFYRHVAIYLIVNIALFVIRGGVLNYFESNKPDKNFVDWVDWNILIVPIFWGIGLLLHAAKVYQYKVRIIRDWEDKKLKEILNEEEFNR